MKIKLWGTRGSLANAGPDTVRYGGNTSCVEVRANDGSLLILDAGTGIRRLGETLIGHHTGRIDILLTHLHMDHIVGLGFFAPLFNDGTEVHIWGPSSLMVRIQSRLSRYLSPPLFPVMIRDLPSLKVHDIRRGRFDIGSFHIEADLVCHPGFTYGYRVTVDGKTLTYLPDHELALASPTFSAGEQWISGLDLARHADVLIHDTQYTSEEYPDHVGWGHSDLKRTLEFARIAGVKRLITFHHDPSHNDQSMDTLIYEARGTNLPFYLHPGTEGLTLEI